MIEIVNCVNTFIFCLSFRWDIDISVRGFPHTQGLQLYLLSLRTKQFDKFIRICVAADKYTVVVFIGTHTLKLSNQDLWQ